MRRLVATSLACIATTACQVPLDLANTALDQAPLVSLVQRVELVPGVDGLDPGGGTPVGTDWQDINIFFTESLRAGTTILPSIHLSVDGPDGPLDPSTFYSQVTLIEFGLGRFPARSRLFLRLADAGGVPEGEYRIGLLSPAGGNLVSEGGAVFQGTFFFNVKVAASDGKLPYIVRIGAGPAIPVETVDLGFWLQNEEVSLGGRLPPHAGLRVEFSELMRVSVPIEVTPQAPFVGPIFLPIGVPVIALEEAPGVRLVSSTEEITWTDTVDGTVTRDVTVLNSDSIEGFELDTSYTFRFPGTASTASQQAIVKDRSGDPLTIRFRPTTAQFDDEVIAAMRKVALPDTRTLSTAPVRLDTPERNSFINLADLGGPVGPAGAQIPVSGTLADTVDTVRVSLREPVQITPGPGDPTTRTTLPDANRVGVAIDAFDGNVAFSAFAPDGEFKIFAQGFSAAGISLGWDVVQITKDTIVPQLLSGGEVTALFVQDQQTSEFCISVSSDTVLAEIVIDPGTPQEDVLGTSSDSSEVFDPAVGATVTQFCFDPVDIPQVFRPGLNPWTVRLTDAAGNVSLLTGGLRLRPVLLSITPQSAEPGELITIVGHGISGIDASDVGVFDGNRVSLGARVRGDTGPGPPIFFGARVIALDATTFLPVTGEVTLRMPLFTPSGPLGFELIPDGTRSTTLPATNCTPVVHPFVVPTRQRGLGRGPFLGDIALTRVTSIPGLLPSLDTFAPGGVPVVFNFEGSATAEAVQARVFDPLGSGNDPVVRWPGAASPGGALPPTIVRLLLPPAFFTGALSAATNPLGDVVVAYSYQLGSANGVSTWVVEVAERQEENGALVWNERTVAVHTATGVPAKAPNALALAFRNDGRAAVVYSLPDSGGRPVVFVAIEQSIGGSFGAAVLLDGADGGAGAISAEFDSQRQLWVAFNRDLSYVGDPFAGTPFRIEVRRVQEGLFGGGLFVLEEPSPGNGLWPSLSVDPITNGPEIAFQSTGAFGPLNGASRLELGPIQRARLSGSAWIADAVDPEPIAPELPFVPGIFETAANINLRIPRLTLDHDPTGVARVAYGRPVGSTVLATREQGSTEWNRDLLEVLPRPGTFVAMKLDALGTARLAHFDEELQTIRFYREEEGRALRYGANARPACGSTRYLNLSLPFEPGSALDAHTGFLFTLRTIEDLRLITEGLTFTDLQDGSVTQEDLEGRFPQVDFFVTALRRHVVELESGLRVRSTGEVRNVHRFELITRPENRTPVPASDEWVNELEIEVDPGAEPPFTSGFRWRFGVPGTTRRIDVNLPNAIQSPTISCCEGPLRPIPAGRIDPTCQVIQCQGTSTLTDCLGSGGKAVDVCLLKELGLVMIGAGELLPRLPAGPTTIPDTTGTITSSGIRLAQLNLDVETSPQGTGSPEIAIDFGDFFAEVEITSFDFDVLNVTISLDEHNDCTPFDVSVGNSAGVLATRSTIAVESQRFLVNGTQRSSRLGQPRLVNARASGLEDGLAVAVNFPPLCGTQPQNLILGSLLPELLEPILAEVLRREIAGELDLSALGAIGDVIVLPLIEERLLVAPFPPPFPPTVDGRRGVVLQWTGTELISIHEPALGTGLPP